MSPEFTAKWEHILQDVEKNKIPISFITKLVIKLSGKKQHTVNVQRMMKQGLDPDQIEEVLNRKLEELDDNITSVEFVLNVEMIAETVQPLTDEMLKNL